MQGYKLCVLDYEFQILDNGFLVHKPGIKILKKGKSNDLLFLDQMTWSLGHMLFLYRHDINVNLLLFSDSKRDMLVAKTNQLIRKIIYPELKAMYGVRNGCGI